MVRLVSHVGTVQFTSNDINKTVKSGRCNRLLLCLGSPYESPKNGTAIIAIFIRVINAPSVLGREDRRDILCENHGQAHAHRSNLRDASGRRRCGASDCKTRIVMPKRCRLN